MIIIDFYSFCDVPAHRLANTLQTFLILHQVIAFDGFRFLYHFEVSEYLTAHFVNVKSPQQPYVTIKPALTSDDMMCAILGYITKTLKWHKN